MDIAGVRQSRGYHGAVGVGLVSYGVLHVVLAWLAVQVALGKKGDASQQGALTQLAQQPLGVALLWVMAVGLFTLTVWQALEATIGRDEPGRDSRPRRRIASVGRAVVYLGLGILAVGVATGSGSRSGKSEETLSARLMSVPFGRVLVAAVGAAVIAVAVAHVVKGVKQNFTEDLRSGASLGVRRLGTVGLLRQGREPGDHRAALRVGRDHLRPQEGGRDGRCPEHRARPAVRVDPAGDHGVGNRLLRRLLLRLGPACPLLIMVGRTFLGANDDGCPV